MSGVLFPDYDEFMEQRAAESQQAYETRLLKQLYDALHTPTRFGEEKREAGDEFGFMWYAANHELPIQLYSTRAAAAPAELLRAAGMTKTKVWKTYFECKANHDKHQVVGLVFPVSGLTQFIVHNWKTLFQKPGIPRVIRPARNADKHLVIEPYKTFCEELAMWSGKT